MFAVHRVVGTMEERAVIDLVQLLGIENVLAGEALKERYNHIWRMEESLDALALTLPKTTQDVSAILHYCHDQNIPVVMHGGLTNLVGSTETNAKEVVISLEKMNTIEELDGASRTITVQAGVILEHVQQAAKEQGLLLPLNFGAKGSAQIGGILSTNAGGLRVLRYGMARNFVLGLEVVLADGTVLTNLKKIIKDNSGYDLKQLFIGAEGTLGVITRAVLRLREAPRSRTSAYVGINDYEKVVSFLRFMDGGMAGTLSAYELIWKSTFTRMTTPPSLTTPPLPLDYSYYVLVEGLGSDQAADQARLEGLLEQAMSEGLIEDAAFAFSESDFEWFWKIREDVHVLVSQTKYDQHFDISLPIPLIGPVLAGISEELHALQGVEDVFVFGHVADGNIHLIIGKEDESTELREKINAIVYGPLKGINGSVSAEHGIGVHKKQYLPLCRSEAEIALMKTLKRSLDPKNILNRGKILDI